MCQVLKCQLLSDHAFPMHLHLQPQMAQLSLCLSSLGLGGSLSRAGAGAAVPSGGPRFSRATVLTQAFHGARWQNQVLLWFR